MATAFNLKLTVVSKATTQRKNKIIVRISGACEQLMDLARTLTSRELATTRWLQTFSLDLDSHLSEQPDRVSVLNVATKSNGDLDTILGSAYVPDPEHPGELLVQFPGSKSASSNK